MGFDVGAVGNHEFDEGGAELLRVLQGSRYQWLAANTVDPATGATFLPPYRVIERAGVRVGFIGVTTDDTPTWLLPEFKREYRFLDISDTVNRWVPELRASGVEAIVVLAHSGAFQEGERRRARSRTRPRRWTTPSTSSSPGTRTRSSTSPSTASWSSSRSRTGRATTASRSASTA